MSEMEFTIDGLAWAREHVTDLSAVAIVEMLDEIKRLQVEADGLRHTIGEANSMLSENLHENNRLNAALADADEDAAALDAEVVALLGCMEPGKDYDDVAAKHNAHRARVGGE